MTSPDEETDPYGQYDDPIYRQAATEAWVSTRMEREKSLLTLSTSGIGLLVTLMTTVGVGSVWEWGCYALALFFFVCTIGSVLRILNKNADYLKATITNGGSEKRLEQKLDNLDHLSIYAFAFGVIFSIAVGCAAALTS